MRMCFLCKANRNLCMVNNAVFQMKDGSEVVVDREETNWAYDRELHELSMDWRGCYYWDGETERPLDDDNVHELDQAVKVWLSPEEDAPDDYLVILKECCLDDGTLFPKGGAR